MWEAVARPPLFLPARSPVEYSSRTPRTLAQVLMWQEFPGPSLWALELGDEVDFCRKVEHLLFTWTLGAPGAQRLQGSSVFLRPRAVLLRGLLRPRN